MKKKMAAILTLAISCTQLLTAQVKFPQPSPTQTIKQDLGLGTVEVTYSRPSAKGRKVFGDLVPMNKLWRTGANGATRISFSEPVEMGGKKIDTGSYVLYTIPGDEEWEVIVNKGLNNWGVDGYKEAEDVVRFKVPAAKAKKELETFTMQFSDVKASGCNLDLMWEKKSVSIYIKTIFMDKLRAQLDAALQSDKKPYWQAAQFYFEYETNLNKALENVNKAIEGNTKAFWMYLYKARIQKELGDNAGALESSKTSLALAKEAKNDDYVRMNEKLQKELK